MKIPVVIVVIFLGVWAYGQQIELQCPSPKWDLNRRTDRCYWFNNEDMVASYQADEQCRRWNGHLVSVNDMTENDYIFGKFPTDSFYAYIGLNDQAVEAEYRWIEGDLLLDWAGNFPVDYVNEGKYDCVVMKTGTNGDGSWQEVQCNEKYGFICEAPAAP